MSSSGRQSPAFQQLTADNYGPGVIVASYIFFIITTIVVFPRLVTRYQITRKFSTDDYLIVASILFMLGQTIALTFAVNNGLGRHRDAISDSQFDGFVKVDYLCIACPIDTNSVFCKVVYEPTDHEHTTSETSVAGMQGYLGDYQPLGIRSSIRDHLGVQASRVWGYHGHCVNQGALYLSNVVWNISTDFALILLPCFLMWDVQVSTHKRWVVIGLFGCRIIVPAFAIAGAVAQAKYWTASPSDPTWYATKGALWNQATISLSIIAACIPCIKNFLADLSSGMLTVKISKSMELTMKNTSSSAGPMNSSTHSVGFLLTKLLASRNNSQMKSRSNIIDDLGKKSQPNTPTFVSAEQGQGKSLVERSESMKGLTDDITLQTISYGVNYELGSDSGKWEESTTSNI